MKINLIGNTRAVLIALFIFFNLPGYLFAQTDTSKLKFDPIPIVFVDELPKYKDDETSYSINCYMQQNLDKSKLAISDTTSIVAFFTVDSVGHIRDVTIHKSKYPEAENELIKVIGSMPKWTPGKSKGKKVSVMMNYILRLPFDPKRLKCE